MRRAQPNNYCYIVALFFEQGYLIGIFKVAILCARVFGHFLLLVVFFSLGGVRFSALCLFDMSLSSSLCSVSCCLGGIWFSPCFLLYRSISSFIFCSGIRPSISCYLFTALLFVEFSGVFAMFGGKVFYEASKDFAFNVLAWWGFTSRTSVLWLLLCSFLNRSGSAEASPSAQHSGCFWYCCCFWHWLTGFVFGFPTVTSCRYANYFDVTDFNRFFDWSALFCSLVGFANTQSSCFESKKKDFMFFLCRLLKALWSSFS